MSYLPDSLDPGQSVRSRSLASRNQTPDALHPANQLPLTVALLKPNPNSFTPKIYVASKITV